MASNATAMGLGEQHYGDIQVPIEDLALGTSAPTAGNTDLFRFYAFTLAPANDDGNFTFCVPRDWKPATAIDVQVYWACNENYAVNSGEIRWRIIYEPIANAGTEVVGAGTETTVNSADVNLPTTARQLTTTTLSIAGANIAVQELVRVTLMRTALVGGNNPAAQEPEVYRIVLHYTRMFPTHYQD